MHATDCTGCPKCNTEFAALLSEQSPHALSRRLAAGTAKTFRAVRLAATAGTVPAPPNMTDAINQARTPAPHVPITPAQVAAWMHKE